MRTALLSVCLLAAVVSLAFPSSVSAGANVTLFTFEDTCVTQLGEPAQISFPSSPSCSSQPGVAGSFVFYCGPDSSNASYTNFTLSLYDSTDCSGATTNSIQSDGPTGQCVDATLLVRGQTLQAGALVSCDNHTSAAAAQTQHQHETRTMTHGTQQTAEAQRQQGSPNEGQQRSDSAFVKLLKAVRPTD